MKHHQNFSSIELRQKLASLGPMNLHEAAVYALATEDEIRELIRGRSIKGFIGQNEDGSERVIVHRKAIDDFYYYSPLWQNNPVSSALTQIDTTLTSLSVEICETMHEVVEKVNKENVKQ